MRKREASKRERSAVDKSKGAVIVRVQALFDEAEHRFSGREARLKREEKRPKLVFPDPDTVGFNLPYHLVGDSADYMTKKQAPGTDKHGFTRTEVSYTSTYTQTNTHKYTQTYIFSRIGHKLAHNFAHFATFHHPLSLSLSLSLSLDV